MGAAWILDFATTCPRRYLGNKTRSIWQCPKNSCCMFSSWFGLPPVPWCEFHHPYHLVWRDQTSRLLLVELHCQLSLTFTSKWFQFTLSLPIRRSVEINMHCSEVSPHLNLHRDLQYHALSAVRHEVIGKTHIAQENYTLTSRQLPKIPRDTALFLRGLHILQVPWGCCDTFPARTRLADRPWSMENSTYATSPGICES